MGELGALFNPGMRHELEERRSKAMRREEEGNARDGDLRIDLESGVAVINVPGAEGSSAAQDDPTAQDSAPGQDDAAGRDQAAAVTADGAPASDAPAARQPAATDAPAADAAAAPAAPPRPRGKRGLAASSR